MQVRSIAYLLLAGVVAGVFALGPALAPAQETPASREAASESGNEGGNNEGEQEKIVLGWVENIRLLPGRLLMKAKLDPGARSSAIHAEDIEEFEKDGRRMVRFTIRTDHDDPDSERIVMERPLVREVNIKLRNNETPDQRPAVRLEFCLAGERHNALFTLTNRRNFNYPVLLGRQFLRGNILVDSSESFTHKTRCPR